MYVPLLLIFILILIFIPFLFRQEKEEGKIRIKSKITIKSVNRTPIFTPQICPIHIPMGPVFFTRDFEGKHLEKAFDQHLPCSVACLMHGQNPRTGRGIPVHATFN